MNVDDESILSAYLDDELDPPARRTVDQALAADPALFDRLDALASASRAVSGLSRPAITADLSGEIVAAIDQEVARGKRRPYYRLATAASVVMALGLAIRASRAPEGAPKRLVEPPAQVVAVEPAPATIAEHVVAPASAPPAAERVEPVKLGPAPDPLGAERGQLISLLDRPGARRVFILTDVFDPAAAGRVNALLRDLPRMNRDFGRLSVAQEIVVDPEFPNQAEVFVVVMNDAERNLFVKRMANNYGDVYRIVEEPRTDPRLLTQLADVGEIRVDRGEVVAAGLEDGRGERLIAIRADPAKPDVDEDSIGQGQGPVKPGEPRPGPRVPVLVWVTSGAREHDSPRGLGVPR